MRRIFTDLVKIVSRNNLCNGLNSAGLIASRRWSTTTSSKIDKDTVSKRQNLLTDNDSRRRTEELLKQLEQKERVASFFRLFRTPYWCQKYGRTLEARFVNCILEWWMQMRRAYDDGLVLEKPSSLLYHLGRLNRKYDGAIVKNLGHEPILFLLNLMDDLDFQRLRADDLISFLSGIRDLALTSDLQQVAHAELLPNADVWSGKILQFLLSYDERQTSDTERRLLITRNAVIIFSCLCQCRIIDSSRKDLINLLGKLCMNGLQYRTQTRLLLDGESQKTVNDLLTAYAHGWDMLQLNPDDFVKDSWKNWHRVRHMISTRRTTTSTRN